MATNNQTAKSAVIVEDLRTEYAIVGDEGMIDGYYDEEIARTHASMRNDYVLMSRMVTPWRKA